MKSTAWIPAAAGAALLLAGCAARLPEEELCLARARLDKCLDSVSTQSEMNIISADIYAIARMERSWGC